MAACCRTAAAALFLLYCCLYLLSHPADAQIDVVYSNVLTALGKGPGLTTFFYHVRRNPEVFALLMYDSAAVTVLAPSDFVRE